MQMTFHLQLQAHRSENINQLEEQKLHHEMEVAHLKAVYEAKRSTNGVPANGNLALAATLLAEENMNLKRQLSAKVRHMEATRMLSLENGTEPLRVEVRTMADAENAAKRASADSRQRMRT